MAKGRNTTVVAARITDTLNDAAIRRAEELGLTLSELVGRALEELLANTGVGGGFDDNRSRED